MTAHIEGQDLDIEKLVEEHPPRSELAIFTIRKADLAKLKGLDLLPLKTLGLRWMSAPDLTEVPFPKTLKELSVWHCSKLRSLNGLQEAENLEHLGLEDNGPLENLDAIGGLKNLTSLTIIGGFNALQKISSLKALEGLKIRRLILRAVAGSDLDLSPVAGLGHLEALDIHGPNFEPRELAKVAAAHPWFLEQLLDLEDYTLGGMNCAKCGGRQKQMFLKRKKFLRCPICDEAIMHRTIDEFVKLVESLR